MANSINNMHLKTWAYNTDAFSQCDYKIDWCDFLFTCRVSRCKFMKRIYKLNKNIPNLFKR